MFFRYLKGYVTVFISGLEVSRFLNLCANHSIQIWDIQMEEEGYFMKMEAKDLFFIKDILKKTNSKLRIKKKRGLWFWWKKQIKRKVFFAGPFLCFFLLWFFSRFLWSVEILGNYQLSRDVLMDFLKEEGVHYGMALNQIPLAQIKSSLRESYEEINWVSVSVTGTTLEIRIKENDVWSKERKELPGTDLISPVEGKVTDILVRQGVALVKKGDEVKKGDVLIEGKIPIPDENGEIKRIEYCQGDGDVWITSHYPVNEKLELLHEKREYSGKERKKYYLEFGEKKLGFDPRKIPYEEYDIIEERKNPKLLGDILLPVTLCTRVYREYTSVKANYSQKEGEKILQERFAKIIEALEKKGVQIIEKNVKIIPNSVSLSMEGTLTILSLYNQEVQLEEKEEQKETK